MGLSNAGKAAEATARMTSGSLLVAMQIALSIILDWSYSESASSASCRAILSQHGLYAGCLGGSRTSSTLKNLRV